MYYEDDEDEKPFISLSKYQKETKVNIEITSLLEEVTRHLATIANLRNLIEIEHSYRMTCYEIEAKEDHIKDVARMAREQLEEGIEDFDDTNAYLRELRRDLEPEISSLYWEKQSQQRTLSELKKKVKKESYSEDDKHLVEIEIDGLFSILSVGFEKVTQLRRLIYLINEYDNLQSLTSAYTHILDETREALENCQDKNEVEKLQMENDKWKAFYEPLLEELKPQFDKVSSEYFILRSKLF